MIKINLLPVSERQTKRRLSLPSFSGSGTLAIWGLVIVGLYAGMVVAMATLQARRIKDLEHKVAEARKEAAELAPQLERIRKLTKEREEVNKRLGVIAALDRDRYYRVQVLNDISKKLPANCWLTSVREQSPTSLAIEGITFSNYIIADLMNNLGKSDRFNQIDLTIAQEGRVLEQSVVKFNLQSRMTSR
ncbi:MAG: PilN domain-containing protein [Candidatus Krumholzibacteriia bacterium]